MNLPPRTAKLPHGRPEAVLGRDMLRALGSIPDVAMYNNESGRGYTGSLARALEAALPPATWALVKPIMQRHRISWGMGVGSPDYFGAVAGNALGIETKSERGVVSDEQADWHAAARERGVRVVVARTVEEVLRAVEVVRVGGWP